jgi:hypothetical protein
MLPDARIVHQTSERMRLKIPSKKGDELYFLSLKKELSKQKGVEDLEVNPLTGSLLVLHNGNRQDLIHFAESKELFKVAAEEKQHYGSLTSIVLGLFNSVNNVIKDLTKKELDIPAIAFLALISVAIYQIARGNFKAPAWYTALWYGTNIFLKSLAKKEKSES